MDNEMLKFVGKDQWLVIDMYRFLHYLNVFYNRLYVLMSTETFEYYLLSNNLKYSLDNINKGYELKINSIFMRSPFEISLNGIGDILKEIREFYKDISYRNKFEQEKYKLDIEIKRTDLIQKKIRVLKDAGLSESEINGIIRILINPVCKMLKSAEKNNVTIL